MSHLNIRTQRCSVVPAEDIQCYLTFGEEMLSLCTFLFSTFHFLSYQRICYISYDLIICISVCFLIHPPGGDTSTNLRCSWRTATNLSSSSPLLSHRLMRSGSRHCRPSLLSLTSAPRSRIPSPVLAQVPRCPPSHPPPVPQSIRPR